MSYTQNLIDHLQPLLTEEEFKKIQPLITGFAKARAVKREAEAKQQDPDLINFGKYKGRTAQQIHAVDADYISWLTRSDLGKRNPKLLATCLRLIYV